MGLAVDVEVVGNGFVFAGGGAVGNEDSDGRGVALEPEPCAWT